MTVLSLSPFPILETGRLILRPLQEDDAEEIFKLRSDDEVNEFLNRAKATSIEDAKRFIEKIQSIVADNKGITWAITVKPSQRLVGTILFWNFDIEANKAEIGFELLPEFQRKGIMQEALTTVLDYGFTKLKLDVIEGYTHVRNQRSKLLLERSGFQKSEVEIIEDGPAGSSTLSIYTINRP